MQRFTDKVVIITGAASGLGLATAQRIAQEGGKLVLVDIVGTVLEQAAATLDCRDVTVFAADVSQEKEVQAYVQETMAKHGRIDGFFNNAGVVGRQGEATDSYGSDEFRRVLSVNLDGVFYGMAEVLKVMKEQRSGSIVNTASVGGFRGIGNQSAYAASKMGVIGLANNAVVEYGQYGVQINVIAPGSIMTPMVERALRRLAGDDWQKAGDKFVENNPMRRSGTPEEVGALVAFLLSGEATYVNGVVIPVDGGQSSQF